MRDLATKDVARRLRKGVSTISLWCRQGRFPNARAEETPRGPVWLIPESDLENFKTPEVGRPRELKRDSQPRPKRVRKAKKR